jgi:hypothetical protein
VLRLPDTKNIKNRRKRAHIENGALANGLSESRIRGNILKSVFGW